MAMRNQSLGTVVGTFGYRDKADAAVTALKAAGFANSDIGVIARRTSEWQDVSDQPTTTEENSATGAVAGATAGAGIGGLWALGIAAGVMPALGPIIAGGVLGSVLASAAAGAAAGGVAGALIGLGVSEEEASYYQGELESGRTVVTVRAGDRFDEAQSIIRNYGGMVSPYVERQATVQM
jgi:hypothetical protein